MVLSFCAALQCQWPEYRSSVSAAPALPGRLIFPAGFNALAGSVSNADEKANAAFMILT
ncbi:hypothetical protein [Mesorhizobium sp. M0590]|uniref:hypothetical protein n=1 Tax=Mesorhizobium sp. M0590 TaxID=2956966 RepID=UPI003335F50D